MVMYSLKYTEILGEKEILPNQIEEHPAGNGVERVGFPPKYALYLS